jgi:hypothetical protein
MISWKNPRRLQGNAHAPHAADGTSERRHAFTQEDRTPDACQGAGMQNKM